MALPAGTVTFLFADIEASTRLLSQHPREYASAVLRLDSLVRSAVGAAHGTVFETVGDAVYAAFERPSDGLTAALNAQRALESAEWGVLGAVRMRMAVHTGEVEVRGDHYFGAPLYRCARMMAIGHGEQVLVSAATAALVQGSLPERAQLRAMGLHRLKDFPEPEPVFQLVHPDLRPEFPPLRSLDVLPNNLPTQTTPFVGRQPERQRVAAALAEHRVVTLTGPGGSGKTRLALEAAGDVLAEYPDGVWLVELAPLAEPDLISQTVAAVLQVQEEPGRAIDQTLTDALRGRTTLLVLDNCEHLVDAVARQVEAIDRGCPGVRILATSREPLAVSGEMLLAVAPLGDADAVALFVQRAHRASSSFAMDDATSASVAAICRRLDGIPLAIELAASRVRAFSVGEIERRLDDRFRFLTTGGRAALPHHRTLRGLIEWSYELLEPGEREVLASLSVFAGSFDLEAAEGVCATGGADGDASVLVGRLADKSLVEAKPPRYRLLDTIRAFAEEKVGARGAALRDRHLVWCADLAERAGVELEGSRQADWLGRLDDAHDNMRAALRWAAAGHDRMTGVRLAGALSSFWATRGYWSEGRAWIERLLGPSPNGEPRGRGIRARALYGAATLAYHQGDYDSATELCGAALAIQRELGDKPGVVLSLIRLGLIADERGDLERAALLHEESLTAAREIGDRRHTAWALTNLGRNAWHAGDYERASSLDEEALALHRAIGNPQSVAITLNNLGNIAHSRGDYARAGSLYEESLAIQRELGYRRGVAVVLRNLGEVAYLLGEHDLATVRFAESLTLMRDLGLKGAIPGLLDVLASIAARAGAPKRAALLFGAAAALRDSMHAARRPADWPDYNESMALARASQDDGSFAAEWARGAGMPIDGVIALALAEG